MIILRISTLPLRKIIFLGQSLGLADCRGHPLSRLDPDLGGRSGHIDGSLLLLVFRELLVDGVLELKHPLVVDGEEGVALGVDHHAAQVDVVRGADGVVRVQCFGPHTYGDVSDHFSLLPQVDVYHLAGGNQQTSMTKRDEEPNAAARAWDGPSE